MTTTDAFQRDRVRGPRETALARHASLLTGLVVVCAVIAFISWIALIASPPQSGAQDILAPAGWVFTSTTLGCCLLAARLVIGALRGAAEAAGE
jgi:hypothetical protein